MALRFAGEIIEDSYGFEEGWNQTKKGSKMATEDGGIQFVTYSHDGEVMYAVNKQGHALGVF